MYAVNHPELPSCSNPDDQLFLTRTLIDDANGSARSGQAPSRTVWKNCNTYHALLWQPRWKRGNPRGLSYSYRKAQGLAGGVIHLIYYSAFLVQEGQSVLSVFR